MKQQARKKTGLFVKAKAVSLPISMKQSVEISHFLRYKNTVLAKQHLEEVIALQRAVPFRRYCRNIGHKAGMAAGRYPVKAAKEFLKLVKSVESNANSQGLDTSNLKIVQLLANQASIPMTGGRLRQRTMRTHLEIAVKERKAKGVGEVGKEKRASSLRKSKKEKAGLKEKGVENKQDGERTREEQVKAGEGVKRQ